MVLTLLFVILFFFLVIHKCYGQMNECFVYFYFQKLIPLSKQTNNSIIRFRILFNILAYQKTKKKTYWAMDIRFANNKFIQPKSRFRLISFFADTQFNFKISISFISWLEREAQLLCVTLCCTFQLSTYELLRKL